MLPVTGGLIRRLARQLPGALASGRRDMAADTHDHRIRPGRWPHVHRAIPQLCAAPEDHFDPTLDPFLRGQDAGGRRAYRNARIDLAEVFVASMAGRWWRSVSAWACNHRIARRCRIPTLSASRCLAGGG